MTERDEKPGMPEIYTPAIDGGMYRVPRDNKGYLYVMLSDHDSLRARCEALMRERDEAREWAAEEVRRKQSAMILTEREHDRADKAERKLAGREGWADGAMAALKTRHILNDYQADEVRKAMLASADKDGEGR